MKQNCQLIHTLIDDDIRQKRLPVTSIRFFNRPNDLNKDHLKILVATCKLYFILKLNIKFLSKMYLVL